MTTSVRFEERLDLVSLVGGEIVSDHVDLSASRLVRDDVREKSDELSRGVSRRGLAQNFSGFGVERGIQRQRAVTVVLKPVSLRASRRQRQDRVLAIERLNRRLLVHAEDRRMRGWVEIQSDDISGFFLELRIVRGHVALDPMGSQAMLAPHARDHHVTDTKMCPELACAPVRRPIGGRAPRGFENAGLKPWSQNRSDLTQMATVQACEALIDEASAPTGHKSTAAPNVLADFIPGVTFVEQQDQPRSPRILCATRSTAGSSFKFGTFRPCESDRVRHGRYYSLQMVVTEH